MNAGWRSRRGGAAGAGGRYAAQRPTHLIAPTYEGIDMMGFGPDRRHGNHGDDAASAQRSSRSGSGPSPPGPPHDSVPQVGESAGASGQELDAVSFASGRSEGAAGRGPVAGPPSRAWDDGDSHSGPRARGEASFGLAGSLAQSRSGSNRRASAVLMGSQESAMPRTSMRPLPRREDYDRALMQATTTSFVQSREDAATQPGAMDSTEFSRVSYSTVAHPPTRARTGNRAASPGLRLGDSSVEDSSRSDSASRAHVEDEERGAATGGGRVTADADTASGGHNPARNSPVGTASVDSKASGLGSKVSGRRVDEWLRWLVGRSKSEPAFGNTGGSDVGSSAVETGSVTGTATGSGGSRLASSNKKHAVTFRPGVIDPRSQWLRSWELVVLMVLLYTATVTPYEVAFFQPAFNTLFVINRLVDFTFFVDLVMHFFTAVPGDPTMSVTWIQDYPTIARRYLKSWFLVDFVSVIPYDLIALMMQSDELQQLQALRTLRLLRLAKLFRVLRAIRIFRHWESSININYAIVGLCRFALLMAMSSHWLACLWRLTAELHDNKWESWLAFDNLIDGSRGDQYTAAVYWAVMTLSTIGYGDIAATTTLERAVATGAMLVGSSIWAYIVGSICGVVSSLDAQTLQFRRTMDELNYFMKDEHLPKEMRQRLREYFHQRRALTKALSYQNLLVQMTPSLRQEVAFHINRRWLRHVTWFQRASKDFVSAVAVHLVPAVYAPKELVHGDEFSIVVRGVAAKDGRILTQGDTWGDDIILASSEFRRATPARALTYLEVKSMSQDDLGTVLDAFPEEAHRIRKIANRLLLRRAFIQEAQRRRLLEREKVRAMDSDAAPGHSPRRKDGDGSGAGSGGGQGAASHRTRASEMDAKALEEEEETKSVDVARTASGGGVGAGAGGRAKPTPGPALVPRVAPTWMQGKGKGPGAQSKAAPPPSSVAERAASQPSAAIDQRAATFPASAPSSPAVVALGSAPTRAPAPAAERRTVAEEGQREALWQDTATREDDLGVPLGSLVPVVVTTDASGRERTVLPHRLDCDGSGPRPPSPEEADAAGGSLPDRVRALVSDAVSAEMRGIRGDLRAALATITASAQRGSSTGARHPEREPVQAPTRSAQAAQPPRQAPEPALGKGATAEAGPSQRAEATEQRQRPGPAAAARGRRERDQPGQLARQGSVMAWEMGERSQRAAPLQGLSRQRGGPGGSVGSRMLVRPPPSARDLSKYDSMRLLGR